MTITVIGFFRERPEAENAVKQLSGSGFYRNDIDISYGSFVTPESISMSDSTHQTNDNTLNDNSNKRKENAITRFFNSLFGDNSDDAKKYSSVSQRADSIVTVHAGSREQAEEAANILDDCGAMDIDEGDLIADTYNMVDSNKADSNKAESNKVYFNKIDSNMVDSNMVDSYVVDSNLNREPVVRNVKSTSHYHSDDEKSISYKIKTEEEKAGEEFRNTEVVGQRISHEQIGDPDTGESNSLGLTDKDLAKAGLSRKEIKSIENIAGANLKSRERTRSRIIERQVDEDLRLREEHDRLHRKG